MDKCSGCGKEIDLLNQCWIEYDSCYYCSEFCIIKAFKESNINNIEDPINKIA